MAETGGPRDRGEQPLCRFPARLGARGAMLCSASPPGPKVPQIAAEQELCQRRGGVPRSLSPPPLAGSTEQCWNEMFMRKCIIQHFISSTLHVSLEQEPLRAFITIRAVMQRHFNQSCPCPRASCDGGEGLSWRLLVGSTRASHGCPIAAPPLPRAPQGADGPAWLSFRRSGNVPLGASALRTTSTILGCSWEDGTTRGPSPAGTHSRCQCWQ